MILIDPDRKVPLHVVVAMQEAERLGARCAACSSLDEDDIDGIAEYVGIDQLDFFECYLWHACMSVISVARTRSWNDSAQSVLVSAGFLAKNFSSSALTSFIIWTGERTPEP